MSNRYPIPGAIARGETFDALWRTFTGILSQSLDLCCTITNSPGGAITPFFDLKMRIASCLTNAQQAYNSAVADLRERGIHEAYLARGDAIAREEMMRVISQLDTLVPWLTRVSQGQRTDQIQINLGIANVQMRTDAAIRTLRTLVVRLIQGGVQRALSGAGYTNGYY